MLDILGTSSQTRNAPSRRCLLRVGILGLARLTLPDVLRLRARAAAQGQTPRETAVIQVFLGHHAAPTTGDAVT
jgi:hypothetical protein